VEENSSSSAVSSPHVIYVDNAFAWLEGVQMWGNEAPSLLFANNNSTALLAHVSAAENRDHTAANSRIAFSWTGSTVNLYSSIFHDVAGVNLVGGTVPTADCLISNDLTGVSASFSTNVDPLFFDEAGGDLRVPVNSPAVDYCDTFEYAAISPDVHGETRDYDHPDNPNASPGVPGGIVDVGFDEVWFFFYDGFESGNVSAWSSSIP
jgi:hypothetical protein